MLFKSINTHEVISLPIILWVCNIFIFANAITYTIVHPPIHSVYWFHWRGIHPPTYLSYYPAAVPGAYFHPPIMASIQVLKKVDLNTQTYFTLLHTIGSSRNSTVPNGTVVKPPQEKRRLPSKEAFKGIRVPTYCQVRLGETAEACAHANAWLTYSCTLSVMTKYLNGSDRLYLSLFVCACLYAAAIYLFAYNHAHVQVQMCGHIFHLWMRHHHV